jgi:glucoamylase
MCAMILGTENTKPYVIDAIVGNGRMLVTLTRDGEMQRLFWPHVDGPQHVARLLGGVSLADGKVIWQNSDAWTHTQAYEPDQNILVTTSRLSNGLEVRTVDTAVPGKDILLRHLTLANRGAEPLSLRYVLYQWLRIDENPLYNTVLYDEASDSLIHYRRDIYIAMGASRTITDVAVGYPEALWQETNRARFAGAGVLHGDVAGAALWDLGTVAPGEQVELSLYIVLGRRVEAVRELLAAARDAGAGRLLAETRQYWTRYLAQARPLAVKGHVREQVPALPGIPEAAAAPDAVEALYRRSLLVFKLMCDEETGTVIAAPEFDPAYTSSGGYAYCWGRDAAYITVAMDLAGYHDMAASFYRWAMKAQEPEGWWMHRHYAQGNWGPSWGLIQVDETGSILYGMALHARLHGGDGFAREAWPSVQKAAEWLIGNIDPGTGLPRPSVDLWEERTAEHTYSSGAVFAGLMAAAELAERVGEGDRAVRYRAAAEALRDAIMRECVREGRFLRGRYLQLNAEQHAQALAEGRVVRQRPGLKGHLILEAEEDPVPDSSLLGMAVPFAVVPVDHPVMTATARYLTEALWKAPAGGMLRYTGDHYRGGQNPWVLTTLWLGQYAAARGDRELARQILDWAVARQTRTGLLPEQVDPVTGEAVWVVPLTWSHAMYVLLALELYGA